MKKSIFLIGAIVWTIIALMAVTVLVVALSGVNFSDNLPHWLSPGSITTAFDSNTPLLKEETISLSDITVLEVSTHYQSVKVRLINGSEAIVRHYDTDAATPFTVEIFGNKLSITIPDRTLISFGMINPRLEIDLPRGYAHAVTLKSSSGSVSCDDYPEWSSVTLSNDSGAVRFADGLKCGNLSIATSSGSVNLGRTDASSIDISNSSGSLRLDELNVSGDITLSSASGSINSEDIKASNLTIRSNSGSLNIGNVEAANSVEIASSSGSQYVGYVSADRYRISCNSGSLHYEGLSGAGSVDCSSGSLNCEALDVRGDVSLTSNSGTQRITLAPDQSFEIKISTAWGSIRASGFDLYYTDSHGNNAFGTVGSGSNGTLSIKSSSGSVNID